MSPAISALIEKLSAIPPYVKFDVERFSSGAVWLDVQVGTRWFVLSSGPTSGIGVSELTDDSPAFTPHDHYFDSNEEAANYLLTLVHEAAGASARQAA